MRKVKGFKGLIVLLAFVGVVPVWAMVPEAGAKESCQKLTLYRPVPMYSLVSQGLRHLYEDAHAALEQVQDPRIATLEGDEEIVVGETSYRYFSKAQTLASGALKRQPSGLKKVILIQRCGSQGTFGYVLEQEFRLAKLAPTTTGLPPSVYPNPIPELKE